MLTAVRDTCHARLECRARARGCCTRKLLGTNTHTHTPHATAQPQQLVPTGAPRRQLAVVEPGRIDGPQCLGVFLDSSKGRLIQDALPSIPKVANNCSSSCSGSSKRHASLEAVVVPHILGRKI